MVILDALRTSLHTLQPLLDELGPDTTCVRLLHGAAHDMPGLTIDRYGPILLLQTWRDPLPDGLPHQAAELVNGVLGAELTAVWNHRARKAGPFRRWHEPILPDDPVGLELGLRFDVQPRHRGQDPLLFLDFRAARRWVRANAQGRSVLNLFAYTCGIGVAAAAGGASEVLNVDFAESALAVGATNASLNDVTMGRLHFDALPVMRALAGLPSGARRRQQLPPAPVQARTFDLVVLDPPRWARSKWGAVDVVRDYQSLFKPALLATAPGGTVLATNHVPRVDLGDWTEVLQRCATKAGRPLRDLQILEPEADVPTHDGRHPLKMALCHL